MILTSVPYSALMGKALLDRSYNRFNLNCHSKIDEKTLKYNSGVSCVFKSNTSTLNINYQVHFDNVPFFMSKKLRTEIECVGLNSLGIWELLNVVNSFKGHDQFASEDNISIKIPLNGRKYKEFQLCFPPGGRIVSLSIETDDKPIFRTLPNKIIFLGSSIAQDSNSSAHTNICCYLYRRFNINACTLAISNSNSLKCPELIDYLVNNRNNRKIILVDLVHLNNSLYENFTKKIPINDISFAVLSNTARKEVFDIAKRHQEIKLVDIPGDAMYDEVHLNALGTYLYVNQLEKLGFLS